MSPKVKKALKYAGYPAFYLLVFPVFVVLTFPYERLKDRVIAEFNARQPAGQGVTLSIDDISGYYLTGIEAEGIKMTSPPGPAGEDGKKPKAKVVEVSHVHASISLLNLLIGDTKVSFGADAFGGEISGYSIDSGDSSELSIELEDVAAGDLPMLGDLVGLPMKGTLSGTIQLKLPEKKLSKASGEIDLSTSGLEVGDGKAKIRNTIALPKLVVGELKLEATVDDGKMKVKTFEAKGKDLDLIADGTIRLRDPADTSNADLSMRFKFADSYKNKNDITRSLFGAPGSTMPALFDLDPQMKRAKRPDGFYAWRLVGPLNRLNPTPASSTSRLGTRGGRAGFGGSTGRR